MDTCICCTRPTEPHEAMTTFFYCPFCLLSNCPERQGSCA